MNALALYESLIACDNMIPLEENLEDLRLKTQHLESTMTELRRPIHPSMAMPSVPTNGPPGPAQARDIVAEFFHQRLRLAIERQSIKRLLEQ